MSKYTPEHNPITHYDWHEQRSRAIFNISTAIIDGLRDLQTDDPDDEAHGLPAVFDVLYTVGRTVGDELADRYGWIDHRPDHDGLGYLSDGEIEDWTDGFIEGVIGAMMARGVKVGMHDLMPEEEAAEWLERFADWQTHARQVMRARRLFEYGLSAEEVDHLERVEGGVAW